MPEPETKIVYGKSTAFLSTGFARNNGVMSFRAVLACWMALGCLQGCGLSGETSQRQQATSRESADRSVPEGAWKNSALQAEPSQDSARRPSDPAASTDEKNRSKNTVSLPPLPKPTEHASVPTTGGGAREITSEKLSGYKTHAEYLFIPSRNYPEATVAVMLPADYYHAPNKKYPLVIAFGGAGECARPPRQGALAWLRYYKTDEAAEAISGGSLTPRDFRGLVTEKQLKDFNTRLKHRRCKGIILACPSSPPLSYQGRFELPEYESFVMEELVPELQKRYRTDRGKIGVDGVSMGGARSMYYGFKYPTVFASIGSVQGAFGPYLEHYRELINNNRDVLAHRSIQIVTSDGDTMARSVEHMHRLLEQEKIPHDFMMLTGPHDYIFNQGPGALSLLMFHDQALSWGAFGPVK